MKCPINLEKYATNNDSMRHIDQNQLINKVTGKGKEAWLLAMSLSLLFSQSNEFHPTLFVNTSDFFKVS